MQGVESPGSVTVAGLFSYPVKGCRVNAHRTASVLLTGLAYDREWMIVDARSSPAPFITQRENAALAILTVQTNLTGGLTLSTDDDDSLLVGAPLRKSLIKVKVWSHDTIAFDLGDDAAKWLQRKLVLDYPVRLVKFNRDMRRDCSRLYAGESGAHTFFADGYPLLVTSTASLADLNVRLGGDSASSIPMSRFRPNLVVEGLPPWDEDHVDTLTIGSVVLKLVKPCVRCVVTTTDQTTGIRSSDEPLNTLAGFRNNAELGGVTFGWNAVVMTPGSVSTGDQVSLEYRF